MDHNGRCMVFDTSYSSARAAKPGLGPTDSYHHQREEGVSNSVSNNQNIN